MAAKDGGSEGQGVVSHHGGVKMKSYSSSLCSESLADIVSHNANVKNGWIVLESAVTEEKANASSPSSISVRRNVVADLNGENERMYLSFGINWFDNDKGKGVLKVNLCLLQMEEEELQENEGCFPLVLDSDEDEALIQHNYMNETIPGSAVIVHLQVKENETRLGNVQTIDIDMQGKEFSRLCHGSTQFSINEKQLLLTTAKAEAKIYGSSSNESRYSKLAKYRFWHEQTGAAMEIRSPLMPILQWTKAGDFTFSFRPPSSSSSSLESEAIISRWGSAKTKAKSSKKASFFLDSDTSSGDEMQDEYEEDGFIVCGDGDVNSSEDEKYGQNEQKGGESDSDRDNGNVNYNNDQRSDEDSEESINIKQRHSKKMRTNSRPRLFLELEDSEDE